MMASYKVTLTMASIRPIHYFGNSGNGFMTESHGKVKLSCTMIHSSISAILTNSVVLVLYGWSHGTPRRNAFSSHVIAQNFRDIILEGDASKMTGNLAKRCIYCMKLN